MDFGLSQDGAVAVANYVLVHGAWGGAWAFDALARSLEDAGHNVCSVHLKGLGNRADELSPAITLTDHIDDVTAQAAKSGFDRFILAGHSYGGMIITGVASRVGSCIDALIYIDAFLPGDGQSLWDITGEFEHHHYIESQKHDPGLVAPIFGADIPGLGRHPLLTFLEAVSITAESLKIPRRVYIFANNWEPTPFKRFRDLVMADPMWEYHEFDSAHDVMRDQPDALFSILNAISADQEACR